LPISESREPFVLVHGTPADPLRGYLLSFGQATDAWYETGAKVVLVGHSHLPFACIEGDGLRQPGPDGLRVELGNLRVAVNPGSVGQPRDGDPRAAYAVYDEGAEAISLGRVW